MRGYLPVHHPKVSLIVCTLIVWNSPSSPYPVHNSVSLFPNSLNLVSCIAMKRVQSINVAENSRRVICHLNWIFAMNPPSWNTKKIHRTYARTWKQLIIKWSEWYPMHGCLLELIWNFHTVIPIMIVNGLDVENERQGSIGDSFRRRMRWIVLNTWGFSKSAFSMGYKKDHSLGERLLQIYANLISTL